MNTLGVFEKQLHGLTDNHVVAFDQAPHSQVYLHSAVIKPWLELRTAAELAGFKPFILSGFRDYYRQLAIWKRKITRQVTIKDRHNEILALDASEPLLIKAILSWSAIPGYSRHHWGSDLDIFDASQLDGCYKIKLEPCEFNAPEGPCYDFEVWLKENIEKFGFYRPYQKQNCGVAIEPWHLSHTRTSALFMSKLNLGVFGNFIEASDIIGKEHIQANLKHIFNTYINNPGYHP
jgi:LAS superfamily LD-carboxypeptidase LdcB